MPFQKALSNSPNETNYSRNRRPRVPDSLQLASLARDHQPGLPVIPMWLQFVGAAEPRPRCFTAHYLMEDCMIR